MAGDDESCFRFLFQAEHGKSSQNQTPQATISAIHDTEKVRMKQRLDIAMKKCEEYADVANFSNTNVQGYAWVYTPKQLAYCITPKVGCTFWKRVLRFIAGDYRANRNVSRPAEIDRMEVHYGGLKAIQQRSLHNPIYRTLLSQDHVKAFMFSREPYSRLWSAYIDKIFLPDFWRSISPGIASKFRPKVNKTEKQCGNDVSFREFLKYVIFKLSKGEGINEHFNPIYKQCSPCHMRFEALGKLETFEKDSEYIFNNFDLKNVSSSVSYTINVEEEVNMLIKYNFDLEKHIKTNCYDRIMVAERLWKAFQYNGYISKNTPVPMNYIQKLSNSTDVSIHFQELVLKTIRDQTVDRTTLKKQKKEFLTEAYKDVPLSDLETIPKLFQPDFELFDYDKYPNAIFGTRH